VHRARHQQEGRCLSVCFLTHASHRRCFQSITCLCRAAKHFWLHCGCNLIKMLMPATVAVHCMAPPAVCAGCKRKGPHVVCVHTELGPPARVQHQLLEGCKVGHAEQQVKHLRQQQPKQAACTCVTAEADDKLPTCTSRHVLPGNRPTNWLALAGWQGSQADHHAIWLRRLRQA
jgi:hypothetical protein